MNAAPLSPVLVTGKQAAEMLNPPTRQVFLLSESGELRWGYAGGINPRMIDVESVREYTKRITAPAEAQS